MDWGLPEHIQNVRKMADEFAQKEIAPFAKDDERAHTFRTEVVRKMGDMSFFGCPVPEKYGGTNLGFLAHTVICEEIAKANCSMAIAFNTQTMATAMTILEYGNEQQRQQYIPKLISAETLGCFAVTEPDAASDVMALSTSARQEGNHYILNGSKTWISLGSIADAGIVFARTDARSEYTGLTAFILDMTSDGIQRSPELEKMGWRSLPTSELFFDNVLIPAGNVLGKEGQGFEIMMYCFDNMRLTAAARAVGNCQALLDFAIGYAQSRTQFGCKIGRFQMIQDVIARMIARIESSRLLTYRYANNRDKGINNSAEISLAKYFAAETASLISDEAFAITGAYGCSGQYPIGRFLRDAKMHQIVDGTANIHKQIIAMNALGYDPHTLYKPSHQEGESGA